MMSLLSLHVSFLFPAVPGVDLDWIIAPPKTVKADEPFTASFSLLLKPEFYVWAVQDAQDKFKKNFFKKQDGSFITR